MNFKRPDKMGGFGRFYAEGGRRRKKIPLWGNLAEVFQTFCHFQGDVCLSKIRVVHDQVGPSVLGCYSCWKSLVMPFLPMRIIGGKLLKSHPLSWFATDQHSDCLQFILPNLFCCCRFSIISETKTIFVCKFRKLVPRKNNNGKSYLVHCVWIGEAE